MRRWKALKGNAIIMITWPRQCHVRVEAIAPAILLIGNLVVTMPQQLLPSGVLLRRVIHQVAKSGAGRVHLAQTSSAERFD
jgi:hypothetical protein